MALFGLIDNFIRLAAETGGLWQFHLLRSVVALVILGIVAAALRISMRPLRPGRVVARSFLSSVAMVIYFGCLALMPISQVVAGLFTAPLWVVIFSFVIWGERVGPRRICAVLIGFGGIILVLRPGSQDLSPLLILPVIAGAIYALGNIATRRWCAGEGTLTMLGGFFGCMMIWGLLGVGVLAIFPLPVAEGADGFITRGWVWPGGMFGLMILIQGVGSLIGVGLSIKAYQIADATLVAVCENTLLLFATIWAIVLWHEVPDATGFAGLGLIALAGIIISVRSDAPQPVRAVTLAE
jgi:drug/metabolite transporter (DMT)-like permease